MATITFAKNKATVQLSSVVNSISIGFKELQNEKTTEDELEGTSSRLTVYYNPLEEREPKEYNVQKGGIFNKGATVTITGGDVGPFKATDGTNNVEWG